MNPGPVACLSVSDTGSGIAPEVYARMFEPLLQHQERRRGTGLGLSVVHSIVADLGGAIDVQTVPGRGSTFALWLPVAGELDCVPAEASAAMPMGSGQAVMIVDDEAALLESVEEMLGQLGYEPWVSAPRPKPWTPSMPIPRASTPCSPTRPCRSSAAPSWPPSCGPGGPGLPVLVMSGYGGEQLDARVRAVGARLLLNKPLAMRDIADALARVFASGVR